MPGVSSRSSDQMKQMRVLNLVTGILEKAQNGKHTELKNELSEAVSDTEVEPKMLAKVLLRVMIIPFGLKEKGKKSERIIKFYHSVVAGGIYKTLQEATESEEAMDMDTTNDNDNPNVVLKLRTLKECTKFQTDQRVQVRVRILELINSILIELKPNELEEPLKSKVLDIFLHRSKDKSAIVRARSAGAMKHLIKFEDISEPIIESLRFCVKHDPNHDARKMALQSLLNATDDVEFLFDKIYDMNEVVRKLAFTGIWNKVDIDSIPVETRSRILQFGLAEKTESVRIAAELVLTRWTESCNGDLILLLSKLDVVENRHLCNMVLSCIMKNGETATFEKVDLSIWENKLIPLDRISAEKAFFWRFVAALFSENAYCMEMLMPSVNDFCSYLSRYMELTTTNVMEVDRVVLYELLQVAMVLTPEEAGRRELLGVVHELFRYKYLEVIQIRPLLELFYKHQLVNVERIFVEILQVLLESRKSADTSDLTVNKTVGFQYSNETVRRDQKLKIGILLHKRHNLQREKESAVNSNDFLKAHALQEEIDKVSNDLDDAKKVRSSPEPVEEQSQMNAEDVVYPEGALTLALSAMCIHLCRIHHVSNYTRNFYDFYVTKNMMREEESIRTLVVKVIGMVGLCSKEDALKAMLVCMQALGFDDEGVQIEAFKAIFNLILEYGILLFENDPVVQEIWNRIKDHLEIDISVKREGQSNYDLLIMHFLRSESLSLVKIGVSGIIKLHLAGRMCDPKMVSALITLWSNPANEATKTHKEITAWLPLFPKRGEKQAIMTVEALVPVVRKFVTAARENPAADASPDKLIAFIIRSTDQRQLEKFIPRPRLPHEHLVFAILNELTLIKYGPDMIPLAKGLKLLNLEGCDKSMVSSIIAKVQRLSKSCGRSAIQSLKAFTRNLKSLPHDDTLKEVNSDDSDLSDKDEEDDIVENGRISDASKESSDSE